MIQKAPLHRKRARRVTNRKLCHETDGTTQDRYRHLERPCQSEMAVGYSFLVTTLLRKRCRPISCQNRPQSICIANESVRIASALCDFSKELRCQSNQTESESAMSPVSVSRTRIRVGVELMTIDSEGTAASQARPPGHEPEAVPRDRRHDAGPLSPPGTSLPIRNGDSGPRRSRTDDD